MYNLIVESNIRRGRLKNCKKRCNSLSGFAVHGCSDAQYRDDDSEYSN